MNSTDSTSSAKQSKPAVKRWTAGGVVLAILLAVYSAARPVINQRLGINLPQLTPASFEDQDSTANPKADQSAAPSKPSRDTTVSRTREAEPPLSAPPPSKVTTASRSETTPVSKPRVETKPATKTPPDQPTKPVEVPKQTQSTPTAPDKSPTKSKSPASGTKSTTNDPELLYGILRSLPREEYISPAGLRYTRGSEEGHRLKHLERHTKDQPDRPGNHGVFNGGMEGMLKVLDEAYVKAKAGGKGVEKEEDRGRVIYTVDLRRKIGFIGGKEGNRRNKPHAFRVQLVLEGDRVITAYPR